MEILDRGYAFKIDSLNRHSGVVLSYKRTMEERKWHRVIFKCPKAARELAKLLMQYSDSMELAETGEALNIKPAFYDKGFDNT